MKAHYDDPLQKNWSSIIIYINLPKCGACINFGFKFSYSSLGIMIFTKLMLSNIIWDHLNSRNHGCIYGIQFIIKIVSKFRLHYVFGFINHPNKCLKWLCVDPTHNACHFPFQGDYLLKFQFIAYLWSMP